MGLRAAVAVAGLALGAAASGPFASRWRPALATARADAAANDGPLPASCEVAVVGAGWAGAYFAYRLAVDTATVDPSNVCVFEAGGRAGGRIYSMHDLPGLGDMVLDLGGYRFIETDLLPAQLVFDALKLPTACREPGRNRDPPAPRRRRGAVASTPRGGCVGQLEGSFNVLTLKSTPAH